MKYKYLIALFVAIVVLLCGCEQENNIRQTEEICPVVKIEVSSFASWQLTTIDKEYQAYEQNHFRECLAAAKTGFNGLVESATFSKDYNFMTLFVFEKDIEQLKTQVNKKTQQIIEAVEKNGAVDHIETSDDYTTLKIYLNPKEAKAIVEQFPTGTLSDIENNVNQAYQNLGFVLIPMYHLMRQCEVKGYDDINVVFINAESGHIIIQEEMSVPEDNGLRLTTYIINRSKYLDYSDNTTIKVQYQENVALFDSNTHYAKYLVLNDGFFNKDDVIYIRVDDIPVAPETVTCISFPTKISTPIHPGNEHIQSGVVLDVRSGITLE